MLLTSTSYPLVPHASRQLKRSSWSHRRAEEQTVPVVEVGAGAVEVSEAYRKARAPGMDVPDQNSIFQLAKM